MGEKIPVILSENAGLDRRNEFVKGGIPLKKGFLFNKEEICLFSENSKIPLQTKVLSKWSDNSIKWILLDFRANVKTNKDKKYILKKNNVKKSKDFKWYKDKLRLIDNLVFVDRDNKKHYPIIKKKTVEQEGNLRKTISLMGKFEDVPIVFVGRFNFYADKILKLDITFRNPKAAEHKSGFWDLGDKGSILFKDLFLKVNYKGEIKYKENIGKKLKKIEDVVVYQDSSGNDNWYSKNHINRNNKVKHSFKGYRIYSNGKKISEGKHAQPTIKVGDLFASVKDFWQNFPNSIEADQEGIVVRFFPKQYDDLHELQGGEQKTYTIWLDFNGNDLDWIQEPLIVKSTPEYYSKTKAIPYLTPNTNADKRYQKLIDCAIKGKNSFENKNKIIDEFGWRNFGEIYADHEAVHSEGLVSHYNNQYDIVYGALLQFFRSGKKKWFEIADNLAKHVRDIDIYHTNQDKAAYNHGMFWHTFHYMDAATCTHRSYSKRGINTMSNFNYGVGGGPANEHNYASGLLYNYFLTGNGSFKHAVIDLADWVIDMDDGSKSVLSWLNSKPTGKASCSASIYYHGPGRGSGNSVNVLLDAFELTLEKKYMLKAEELIRRSVHPQKEIAKDSLEDIEHRWFYLVFLQALGRYLDIKNSVKKDKMFYYSKESLLHYAKWMLKKEKAYYDVLDRVDIPSETWPAHDIRKSNVLDFAYKYSGDKKFKERSDYFFNRCIDDLNRFKTKSLTRPLAIIMNFSVMHDYFKDREVKANFVEKRFDLGKPKDFKPQGYYLYKLRDFINKLKSKII